MNKISSGLLFLLAAGALGVFWVNGYLARWTGEITAGIAGTAPKTPLALPQLLTSRAAPGAKGFLALPAVPPIGGIA